jgi:hypothetical protein
VCVQHKDASYNDTLVSKERTVFTILANEETYVFLLRVNYDVIDTLDNFVLDVSIHHMDFHFSSHTLLPATRAPRNPQLQ